MRLLIFIQLLGC